LKEGHPLFLGIRIRNREHVHGTQRNAAYKAEDEKSCGRRIRPKRKKKGRGTKNKAAYKKLNFDPKTLYPACGR